MDAGPDEPGARLLENLKRCGYRGRIMPVSAAAAEAGGMACAPDPETAAGLLDRPPDLVMAVPPQEDDGKEAPDFLPELIRRCGRLGAAGIVACAGGERRRNDGRASRRSSLAAIARESGVRLLGISSMGFAVPHLSLNAGFARDLPLTGRTAFISQSGSVSAAILDISLHSKIGFRYFIHLGSMADLDFADLIDYLGNDPGVDAILLYMEHLRGFRRFMSAARSVARIKPIIALKSGRSAVGAAAAAAHTGVMAGEDAVYDAAFHRCGILRIHRFHDLFDMAGLMARRSRQHGGRLAVVTNAGGPAVGAVDCLESLHHGGGGVAPAVFSEETIERLDAVAPNGWSRSNPADLNAFATPAQLASAAEICMVAPETDAVLVIVTPHENSCPEETARALAAVFPESVRHARALYTVWMGGPRMEKGRAILHRAGIPVFDSPERAVRAFAALFDHTRCIHMLNEIPARPPLSPGASRRSGSARCGAGAYPEFCGAYSGDAGKEIVRRHLEGEEAGGGRRFLPETAARELLAVCGIPVTDTRRVTDGDAAWRAALEIGFPVALKIDSPDILHKSEADGVRLDLQTEFEVYGAFRRIIDNARQRFPEARLDGVSVQPMVRRGRFEIITGIRRDPSFGPVILFGMGGRMTEIIGDRSLGLPPLNRLLARRMIERTRMYPALAADRHGGIILPRLEELLICLSHMAVDLPEIENLDINPLIITGREIRAVDAHAVLSPSSVPSPHHLVISPYPAVQETRVRLKSGESLFIRPVLPEDAVPMEEMFGRMSAASRYFRFFSPMKELRRDLLVRFTQVDYDREIALVAISEDGEDMAGKTGCRLEGAGRIHTMPDSGAPGGMRAEFAVSIPDDRHGQGVGAAILRRCLEIADERGIRRITGEVMAGNTGMVSLAKKLGFTVGKSGEGGILTLRRIRER